MSAMSSKERNYNISIREYIALMALSFNLLLSATGLLAADPPVRFSGEYFFSSKGQITDFDDTESRKSGNPKDLRVTQDDTIGYDDNSSVKCKGVYGESDKYWIPRAEAAAAGRYHSEVVKRNVVAEGDVCWLSYAIMIRSRKNSTASIIQQWMDPRGWKPQQMMVATPVPRTVNQVGLYLKICTPNPKDPTKGTYVSVGPLRKCKINDGSWIVITTKTKFSTQSSGFNAGYVDVYINGEKVADDPKCGGGGHTYKGATMAFVMAEKKMRYQGGGYFFWGKNSGPADWAENHLDNIVITDGSKSLNDVLPEKLRKSKTITQHLQ